MPRTLALATAAFGCIAAPAFAEPVPLVISHHGRLLDPADQPFTGTIAIRFTLYRYPEPPAVTTGLQDTQYWTESYSVQVTGGIYTVLLGNPEGGKEPIELDDFSGHDLFLGFKIGDDAEMRPRLAVGAAPFAFNAARLEGFAAAHFAAAADLDAEQTARTAAIGAEASAREAAIATEATARGTAIGAAIDAEATARDAAIGTAATAAASALGAHSGDATIHFTLGTGATQAATGNHAHAALDAHVADATLHHTLGTGATQAAAGNHTHAAADITSGTIAQSQVAGLAALAADVAKLKARGELLYESEDLSTDGGAVANDVSASGGKVRTYGTGGSCTQYGPYTSDQPPGHYRAIFRLKGAGKVTIDTNHSGATANTGQLDTSKKVTVNAEWKEYPVKFTRGGTGLMEFRACGADAGVVADYVRIIRDNDPGSPKIIPSASAYTIAQAKTAAGTTSGVAGYGEGNICLAGYHVCNFLEAVVLKYTLDQTQDWPGDYLRTTGTYSWLDLVGQNTPHNALIGYDGGGGWSGPGMRCPAGSGPMIYFENKAQAAAGNPGHSWTGACYNDDSRKWACCLNVNEY